MGRYVHFEHYVDDPQKAVEFYQKVFDWAGQQWGEIPYWLITSGPDEQPGINGGIGSSPPPNGQKVVNVLGVDDIDDAVRRSQEAGAVVLQEKMAIPGMGWAAYLTDPTDVVFGIFMQDSEAA